MLSLIRSSVMNFTVGCLVAAVLSACAPKDLLSDLLASATTCMSSGDIVVSNSGTDAVLVLNSDGTFKRTALELTNTTENIFGIRFDTVNNRLLVVIDGVDRVLSVDATTCAVTEFAIDINLTGNVRGVTRLVSGDVLVVETNTIERFNVTGNGDGIRYATGWPVTAQTAGTGVHALSAGGFVNCGSTAARTYSDTGAAVSANKVSGITGTTAASDCRELTSGDIAVVWSGTTDTVAIYNSTLATTVATYSNLSLLSTPGGIAQRTNGNLLVLDRVLNHIVEITDSGSFVTLLGGAVLNTPEFIEVIP